MSAAFSSSGGFVGVPTAEVGNPERFLHPNGRFFVGVLHLFPTLDSLIAAAQSRARLIDRNEVWSQPWTVRRVVTQSTVETRYVEVV